jgi:hypothetical protein
MVLRRMVCVAILDRWEQLDLQEHLALQALRVLPAVFLDQQDLQEHLALLDLQEHLALQAPMVLKDLRDRLVLPGNRVPMQDVGQFSQRRLSIKLRLLI